MDGNLVNTITDEIVHYAPNTIILVLETSKLRVGKTNLI